MHIIAIQHAQSEQHLNGMIGGSTEWPLTPRGRRHAKKIAQALRRKLGYRPNYVLYSSDMQRTAQTAAPIAKALGLEIQWLPDLREIKVGSAAGKSKAWLKENEASREGVPFLDHRPLPDAETWREVSQRVAKALQQIEAADKNAIVVAHGGSLGQFVQQFLRIPQEGSWPHGLAGGVHLLEKREENGNTVYTLHKFNEIYF
jgi:probable phosphoglycerate mutase